MRRPRLLDVYDLLFTCGLLLLTVGLSLWSIPLGVCVLGLALCAIGLRGAHVAQRRPIVQASPSLATEVRPHGSPESTAA